MWLGQTCYITQIKTKRVGAWPLWIFSIVTQIFNVFKKKIAKSSRKKIFFCWGHTNTLGTFLRRSPQQTASNVTLTPKHYNRLTENKVTLTFDLACTELAVWNNSLTTYLVQTRDVHEAGVVDQGAARDVHGHGGSCRAAGGGRQQVII